ncbi:MAG: S46 family peptidase [Bacteroidales bacterium]|nr:S46 family peptidase [Bacteroidales bacterium]
MKRILLIATLLLSSFSSFADEGMWMINTIDRMLEKRMKATGLKLDGKMIYDEEKESLSDAVVALAFSCTGSMISPDGLMITNHHCAYSDIHALSTLDHNYLEDGFWAMNRADELPVKGQAIYFLKKVFDVTGEVMRLRDSLDVAHHPMAMRRVYKLMEDKYAAFYPDQGELICSSYYNGNQYYMALYQVYRDVRLVAAPPVCIASFGGDTDNWEWPQHKGDFAIYRIYTAPDGSPSEYAPENVPLHPKKILKIAQNGLKDGDFTMVIGYPGRTNRFASSYAVEEIVQVQNPIQAQFRMDQMKILDKWMNEEADIRLKYADRYFGLSNVQEIREGEIYCYNRFGVVEAKRTEEQQLQKWLGNSDLIYRLGQKYEDVAGINQQIVYFQETLVRGTNLHRYANALSRGDTVLAQKELKSLDMRVERDLLRYSLRQFYKYVHREYWGAYLTQVYDRCGGDVDAILRDVFEGGHIRDALISCRITGFNEKRDKIEAGESKNDLERQYKNAVYQMKQAKHQLMYPDANSTMRITYGKVRAIQPRDAVSLASKTSTAGILEKYDPDDYEFTLKPEVRELLEKHPDIPVNFLTDNDITGGNSGSPVLNAKGELVGLAFDGNKESLAGDTYFVDAMNRCICVDIRYVLWLLREYAHADTLLSEILSE